MGRRAGLSQILLCGPEGQLGLTPPPIWTRKNGPGLNHRRGVLSIIATSLLSYLRAAGGEGRNYLP